jgi:hypothetical protein
MSDTVEAYFDAAAAHLALPVRPEHREEALAAFRVLTEQARLVTEFDLPAEIEAAPRFTP